MPNNKGQNALASDTTQEYCVFEYLYRDASNYKAWGKLLLLGVPSQNNIAALKKCLESDLYFLAEQVSIPAVYQELWELSGGRTSDDHALHEFVSLRIATDEEKEVMPIFGELTTLLKTFEAVSRWDYSMSPNFDSFWA